MKKLNNVMLMVLLLLTMVCGAVANCYAEIPHLINYQGRLTDSEGQPLEGSYSVTFRIYDALSGGNLLWQETQSVVVQKGVFSVLLGSVTDLNIPFDQPYYLEIKVGNEVMSPRQRITSAGYAFRAKEADTATQANSATQSNNADKVDGFHASSTPQANKILVANSSGKLPAQALKVYDSGWFAWSKGNTYTLNHNLGTTKVIKSVWFASSPSPTSGIYASEFSSMGDGYHNSRGWDIYKLTPTKVKLKIMKYGLFSQTGSSWSTIQSGYARIIMLALE